MFKIFLLLNLLTVFLYSNENFKINKVERKLINPSGSLEMAFEHHVKINENDKHSSYLNASYSLNDNLELVPFGVNYLFINSPRSDYLVGLRYLGTSIKTGAGSSNEIQGKIQGKNRFIEDKFALKYHALFTYAYNTSNSISNGKMFELSFEPIITLNDYLSIGITMKYIEAINDFNSNEKTKHYDAGCNLYMSVNKNIEFNLKYEYFKNLNNSIPAFNLNGYNFYDDGGQLLLFGKIRFFF